MTFRMCVADHETTGLDPSRHESIELFAQIWDAGSGRVPAEQDGTFHRLWLPQGECDPGAAKVNGYTREGWIARGAQPMTAADLIAYDSWIAKWAPESFGGCATHFDVRFTDAMFRRVRVTPANFVTHRQDDIQSLARPLMIAGLMGKPSLNEICKFLGVVNSAPHTAPGDVAATIDCFERLLSRYWPAVVGVPGNG